MRALQEIALPFDLKWLPGGFLKAPRVNILYQLALRASSILEIGSWIGRSTCVMASAIKGRSESVPFHTIDYFIKNDEEWMQRFGVPLASKRNAETYRYHMRKPGGSRQSLEENLVSRELRDLVTIHEGDFLTTDFGRKFDLIFCDATHDRREIDMNMPRLMELLEPGGVLACDDIVNDELRQRLLSHTDFVWHYVHGNLFYGEPV